jgi:hypothetical protein
LIISICLRVGFQETYESLSSSFWDNIRRAFRTNVRFASMGKSHEAALGRPAEMERPDCLNRAWNPSFGMAEVRPVERGELTPRGCRRWVSLYSLE